MDWLMRVWLLMISSWRKSTSLAPSREPHYRTHPCRPFIQGTVCTISAAGERQGLKVICGRFFHNSANCAGLLALAETAKVAQQLHFLRPEAQPLPRGMPPGLLVQRPAFFTGRKHCMRL